MTGLSLGSFAELAGDSEVVTDTVPLLGLAQAGLDGFFDEAGLPAGEGWDQTQLPQPSPTLFSLSISGDSMEPLYRAGDKVLVDQERADVRRGDRVVVRTLTGETLAKELAEIGPDQVVLRSINPDYPNRVLDRSDIAWISRILWVSQ